MLRGPSSDLPIYSWYFAADLNIEGTSNQNEMPLFRKESHVRQRAQLLLESHWRPTIVAKNARCHVLTAFRWERKLAIYSDTVIPPYQYTHTQGPSRLITPAALTALIEYQRQKPWLY